MIIDLLMLLLLLLPALLEQSARLVVAKLSVAAAGNRISHLYE